MGYQALLFCPDEKLARIVAQVFTELEFNVETVQEPFSAVKKLMAQRYAALVVDCENESNASLLFEHSAPRAGSLAVSVSIRASRALAEDWSPGIATMCASSARAPAT